jgi:hypothetical protein
MECNHGGMCICTYVSGNDPFSPPPEQNPEAWLISDDIEKSPQAMAVHAANEALTKFERNPPHKSTKILNEIYARLLENRDTARETFVKFGIACGWVF